MPGYIYRGTNTEDTQTHHLEKPTPDCGTSRGYARHQRNNEPIDEACRQANMARCKERRARKKASA